ncbi:MAG TPA: glycosyltransferase, partial [Dongiaceae bacterium]|nr:glycosyltransferase [Dongiaceae bacterium]
AHYVPEAVESVVAQTLADWELIIVNDGSPDNTSEAARELIARHPGRSIRLIEKPNGGLSSARNAGIRAARGRYILPLDADDKIRPMLLEKLAAILDAKPEVGFAYTHIQHFGALDTEYPLPDFDPATLIGKDNIACVCALFRKSAWEQTGGYNEAMREGYEDWDFWIGCVEHGWAGYCLHEPLFLYRKSGQSMLAQANRKREGLVARIVLNHPKLYDDKTRKWAGELLQSSAAGVGSTLAGRTTGAAEPAESVGHLTTGTRPRLRVTYLISSILGVTGGNQTLLRQAEEMRRRGHEVAIVTHTPKPDWFQFGTRVIQVPAAQPMAACVPPSDVVVATYFTNAAELSAVPAPVKVYYAQGDQFVFSDPAMPDNEQNRRLRELSRASYLLPGVRFVPNSNNLAGAVERLCGRPADGILPVCTDQTIFRPLQRSLPGSRFRLLIVGPDARGTESEPLLFKGIQDIHDALEILARRFPHFTAVRMSATAPDIFARFPCEFYLAPCDEMKTVLYGTSHVHIYASHYDSCPRPPQEAMAAGCAVVCTDTPGAREYCRGGENCLLVPIRSPAAIAEAVERLIKDNALREQLIQGGLATAREYPREREWNEWEALLLRFAQEAARGTSRSPEVLPLAAKAAESAKRAKAAPIKLPACALVGHLGNARESLRLRKLSVAWESTLAAIQARPFHPEAFLLLGEIAHTAGDSVSARRCAQHALSLAPGWKPPKKFLKRNLRGNVRLPWLVLPDALDPQRSPRLTVCVIARNEGQFLGQCLASVRGLAGQIVVVDTGSTDNTVEIAKEQGAEVSSFEWCDDFSAARNAAVERATGDWILMVDADEELPPENHEALRKLLRVAPVIAWRLPIVDAGQEEEGCCYVPRLFRNAPGLFYVGRVHEQVFSSLEVRRQEWGLDNRMGDAGLRHYGYQPQLVKDRRKIERNLRLLEQAIEEFPGEPNLLMNYGLELVRSGQVEKGLDHYRQAVGAMAAQSASEVAPETREMLLTQFCTQLIGLKRYAELVGLLDSPLAKAGGLSASLHFSLGLACLELGRFQEAADQMRQCLLKRAQPSLAPVHKEIRKAGPRHCLAVALEHLGQTEAAAEEFRLAMEEDPKSRPARLDYARFLAGKGQLGEALKLLFALATENPSDLPVWQAGGQLTLSRPGLLEVARNWTAEALRHAPQDSKLLQQRAEALMLSGQCDLALPLWQRLPAGSDPSLMAARLLCKIVAGDNHPSPPPQDEARV